MTTILSICAHGFILGPILIVLVSNLFSRDFARRHFIWFAGAGALWQLFSSIAGYAAIRSGGYNVFDFAVLWNKDAPGAAYFELTPQKFLFLFVIGLVSFISVLIANKTIDFNRSSYTNLLMIIILGMNGMLIVSDLFSLYVFMEITGICCFVMIAMFRSRADLEGSFKYLVMSELASIFILSGLAFIFMKTGSLRYADLSGFTPSGGGLENVLSQFALVLLISGFALKTGAVPFHSWLPDAHQSADTSVSVLLSGVVIKVAGIYGVMTIATLFNDHGPIRASLAVLGLLSIVVGALLAYRQSHFKRVVAYSSVSQMGYILLGISTGTPLGIIGALAHVFSHAAFKSTFFANAAALHEQVGTLEMDEMGGLEKQMPVTSFSSVIAFLSTAGIPPTAGFWSKLLIVLALWSSGQHVLAGAALLASIFTGTYLLRMQKKVFFGKPRPELADVKEIKGTICTAEIILTILTLGVGLCYPFILLYLRAHGLI